MKPPSPEPGLVVRYDFMWSADARAGRQATKDRPVVIALVTNVGPKSQVGVLPITHSKPGPFIPAVEIPASEKRRLGLDDLPSWIIASEMNTDEWPNGIVPFGRDGGYTYGYLSRGIFREVLSLLRKMAAERALSITPRA